jgi:hypothetical protein
MGANQKVFSTTKRLGGIFRVGRGALALLPAFLLLLLVLLLLLALLLLVTVRGLFHPLFLGLLVVVSGPVFVVRLGLAFNLLSVKDYIK